MGVLELVNNILRENRDLFLEALSKQGARMTDLTTNASIHLDDEGEDLVRATYVCQCSGKQGDIRMYIERYIREVYQFFDFLDFARRVCGEIKEKGGGGVSAKH